MDVDVTQHIDDIVKDVIDKSIKAFRGMKTDDFKAADYIYDGTFEGEGSSIIGDGLASCVLGFPKLDEERSRIIILGTDNFVGFFLPLIPLFKNKSAEISLTVLLSLYNTE